MPALTTIAVVGLGLALAAGGTALQFQQGRKQASIAKKTAEEQEKAAALAARRDRRRTIRQARIERGKALNVAAAVGAQGGSGLAGGLSGLSSQAGAELGFSTQTQGIGKRLTKFGTQFAKAGELAAIGGGVAQIGGTILQNRSDIIGALG